MAKCLIMAMDLKHDSVMNKNCGLAIKEQNLFVFIYKVTYFNMPFIAAVLAALIGRM